VERNIDEFETVVVPAKGNEVITFKTPKDQLRTAVEISGGTYKLIKTVWISPLTKKSDIEEAVNSLPKGEAERAERNFAVDVLGKKFRISKRGG